MPLKNATKNDSNTRKVSPLLALSVLLFLAAIASAAYACVRVVHGNYVFSDTISIPIFIFLLPIAIFALNLIPSGIEVERDHTRVLPFLICAFSLLCGIMFPTAYYQGHDNAVSNASKTENKLVAQEYARIHSLDPDRLIINNKKDNAENNLHIYEINTLDKDGRAEYVLVKTQDHKITKLESISKDGAERFIHS